MSLPLSIARSSLVSGQTESADVFLSRPPIDIHKTTTTTTNRCLIFFLHFVLEKEYVDRWRAANWSQQTSPTNYLHPSQGQRKKYRLNTQQKKIFSPLRRDWNKSENVSDVPNHLGILPWEDRTERTKQSDGMECVWCIASTIDLLEHAIKMNRHGIDWRQMDSFFLLRSDSRNLSLHAKHTFRYIYTDCHRRNERTHLKDCRDMRRK